MSALPEERLGQLRVAKLRALLGDRLAGDPVVAAPFGLGAALLAAGGEAAFLVEEAGPRSLGGALTWAVRKGASSLRLIVDAPADVAGRLAREGGFFDLPVVIERIVGTTSEPVAPEVAEPEATAPEVPAAIAELLRGAAVDVVAEHGVVRAEVDGLELARVVDVDGQLRLEVGVGRFDREISTMMFASVPTADALDQAVELVRRHRVAGGTKHPLRDLVPERWLRRLVVADPSLVGADHLEPIATTLAIDSLRDPQPAAASGRRADGSTIVVVCTAGVDLDVVPLAADTRAAVDPGADLVICAPERNLIDATRAVGARLLQPADFVPVELPYS